MNRTVKARIYCLQQDEKEQKMPLTKSYFNVRQKKWYLTAEDAAKWKPGPCVVWEMTEQCSKGAECTCAHLSRDALNTKNQRNKLGNYVECTLPARCKYVLTQIKSGQWAHLKGQVNANAPCIVELLQWLPAQQGGKSDVDVVQSFIATSGEYPHSKLEFSATTIQRWWRRDQDELNLQRLVDKIYIDAEDMEEEIFEKTPSWAPNGDVPVDGEEVEAEASTFLFEQECAIWSFLVLCKYLADQNDWIRLQEVNAQLEWLRTEEQRLKKVAVKSYAAVVSSPLAPRNFGALLDKKPAPVAPAVMGVVDVYDDDDIADYEWKGEENSPLI